MLNFKKWLNENGTSTASIGTPVPNRLFGPPSIPGGYQQPIQSYVKCGLGGCLKKQKHSNQKFFN